jgi:hypothetical protein
MAKKGVGLAVFKELTNRIIAPWMVGYLLRPFGNEEAHRQVGPAARSLPSNNFAFFGNAFAWFTRFLGNDTVILQRLNIGAWSSKFFCRSY